MRKPFLYLAIMMACFTATYYVGTLSPHYRVQADDADTRALAERYQPYLVGGEPASKCYFEALPPRAGKVAVLYRFSWPDERHPIAALHYLYSLWRKIYFGSVEDIEFVWVEADENTGKPLRIAFEAPEVGKVFVAHDFRLLDSFPAEGTHPLLDVASWNHIFEVSRSRFEVRDGKNPVPLEFLDDDSFHRLRMGRRSLPPKDLLPVEPAI